MYGKCHHSADSSAPHIGFLQKNNSLEERIVSSFKERSAKNLLSCDNMGQETRFRRTETDFSNLYARGTRAFIIRIIIEFFFLHKLKNIDTI